MEHQKQFYFLKKKLETSQLAHSYLFSGPREAGIDVFAKEFIKLINCLYSKSNDRENLSIKEKACGECQNCKLIEKGSFPDLLMVKPKAEKEEIEVAEIRNAQNFLSYKSYYGGYKAVIIDNAERMNQEAQSCFLKTLEEPKGKTIIILISSKPETLLPTILSRCQMIKFFPSKKYEFSPEQKAILQNLLLILGQDLAEKFLFTKNVNLENGSVHKILEVLQRHFRSLLLIKIGVVKGEAPKYSVEKLEKILRLIEAISHQVETSNSSPKLALEVLLLEL